MKNLMTNSNLHEENKINPYKLFTQLLAIFGLTMMFTVSGWGVDDCTVTSGYSKNPLVAGTPFIKNDSVGRTSTSEFDTYYFNAPSEGNVTVTLTNIEDDQVRFTSDIGVCPGTTGAKKSETLTLTTDLDFNVKVYKTTTANNTRGYTITVTFTPDDVEGTLVITKTDSVDPVNLNSTFLYYIDVTNNTETTVTNLHLTDTIEDNVTLNSVTNSSFNTDVNWTCTNPTSASIDCILSSLDVNDTLRLELNVTAPAYETTLLNIAEITADNNISENATANTTVTDENITGGVDVSLYRIDTVDEYTFTNYTTEGPILKTKIAAMPGYPFDLVHLDPSTFAPTTYRGSQTGSVAPLIVLLYLADDDCNQLENIYLTGDDDLLARVVLQQGDSSASVVSPVVMPSLAMKKARILAKFDDLNDNNLSVGELRCVLRSSTSGNLGNLPQCFNSESRLREVFPVRGDYCLELFNGNGPCKSNYGNPSAPYTAPYGIEPACYSCLIGGSEGECSRDNFAIRPERFDVNITSGEIFISGKPTNLAFQALDATTPSIATVDYNETQDVSFSVDLNVSNNSGCQIKNLTITPNVSFTNGLHQDDFRFSDIGDINMSIHETNGTEFAIVDFGDTPLDDRLIQEYNVSFTVIPDHFNIDANLTDHNTDNNFTYLHDINRYDADDNYEMGAKLSIDIQALGADDNITRNYMETCYAKDTNVTLTLNSINITYPGSVVPLTHFLYYNPAENNGTADSGEGNYTLASLTSITSLPIENIPSSFPADAPDGNGTTNIEYKLNFNRKQHLAVNPFQMVLTDVDITEIDTTVSLSDLVTGDTGTLTDQNTTMYYARTRASKFFYEDITTVSVITPILVDIYCDLGFSACDALDIDTVNGAIKNYNPKWWLSLGHNETTQNDGNITLIIGSIIEGAGNPTVDTDVTVDTQAQDPDITVTSNASDLPMTVIIDLDETSTTDTNHWLIFNEEDDTLTPTPFYKVRFIGDSNWTGTGITGDVVNINASKKKSKRMDW